MKRILFVAATLALLLSACGPQATPTIDPAQVQASAVAAANTMVAMTQAAIPTATPIPPTPIPSPTLEPSPTPIPLPTLSVLPSPTTTVKTGSANDPCNGVMDIKASGPTTPLRIVNKTSGRITVSIWGSKNAFGQCGYIVAQIGVRDSGTIDVPLTSGGSYYSVYAIINDPSHPSKATGGPYYLNTVSTWVMTIDYDAPPNLGR